MGTPSSNDFFAFLVSKPANLAIIASSGLLQVIFIPLAIIGIIWYQDFKTLLWIKSADPTVCNKSTFNPNTDNYVWTGFDIIGFNGTKIHKSQYLKT
jgi:hypothetical protein